MAISACGGSGDALKRSHLTLIERPISIFVEDNGKHGPTWRRANLPSGVAVQQRRTRRDLRRLENDGTIVAVGVYGAAPGVVVPKRGVTRAVIGGTGKYLGASGQVFQTPLANGNIKNVFTLLTP